MIGVKRVAMWQYRNRTRCIIHPAQYTCLSTHRSRSQHHIHILSQQYFVYGVLHDTWCGSSREYARTKTNHTCLMLENSRQFCRLASRTSCRTDATIMFARCARPQSQAELVSTEDNGLSVLLLAIVFCVGS